MAKTLKERVDQQEERLDKHDRQIAAIRNMLQEGFRLDLEERRARIEFRKDLRSLEAIHKRTEPKLEALIDSMRRGGGDGHAKRRVDIQ